MEEVSPLGCLDSGKSYRGKKKGPWSLGERKQRYCAWGQEMGEGTRVLQSKENVSGEERRWGKAQACQRERECGVGERERTLLPGPLS